MSEEGDFQSNRPYTLFYYPSPRLPPRMMFEDEACRFWCLFDRQLPYSDGEERDLPFSVNAGLKWDVDQLTNAIRQQKRVLYDFDTSDIVLLIVRQSYLLSSVDVRAQMPSQLKVPIPVDPDPTLAERLPKPITDFSVELDRRTLKVSDVFPDRPEGHLHIIVRLRGKQIDRHLCTQD